MVPPRSLLPRRFQPAWAVVLLLLFPLNDTRAANADVEYEHARQLFLHGDLEKSQLEAEQGYTRFLDSDPEWASRFQLLEAKVLIGRGLNKEALRLLSAEPSVIRTQEEVIEKLTLEGTALTLQGNAPLADQKLKTVEHLCVNATFVACGNVLAVRGLQVGKQGKLTQARQLLLQSLSIARAHQDRRLETSALGNLGWLSIQNDRYDEAVDWFGPAYRNDIDLGED